MTEYFNINILVTSRTSFLTVHFKVILALLTLMFPYTSQNKFIKFSKRNFNLNLDWNCH